MPLTFDHIALTSHDISASVSFYREHIADTEVLYEDGSWAYLRCGGMKIALVTSAEHPPHMAFRVGSRAELVEFAEKEGAEIKVHRDRTESFYLYDGSGNAVEVIWYPEGAGE